MYWFSGYNQINMAPQDAEKAFKTLLGNFYYAVLPFSLNNASATYQCALIVIFYDMLHHIVEDYKDDMVVKSNKKLDHLGHLETVVKRCRKFNMRMNPLKCAFGLP